MLKSLLAGADVAQVASVLLRHGPRHIATLLADMQNWMTEREYESITQLKGSMSQRACVEPAAFERANYMKTLNSYA